MNLLHQAARYHSVQTRVRGRASLEFREIVFHGAALRCVREVERAALRFVAAALLVKFMEIGRRAGVRGLGTLPAA
ncbi:MAG: hypothetical protein ABR587_12610, partial [Candidatus Binatia bacterium]